MIWENGQAQNAWGGSTQWLFSNHKSEAKLEKVLSTWLLLELLMVVPGLIPWELVYPRKMLWAGCELGESGETLFPIILPRYGRGLERNLRAKCGVCSRKGVRGGV